MWDRKELKARGKAAFTANYWKTVLVAFLLAAFVLGTTASVTAKTNGEIQDVSVPEVSAENGTITVNGQTYDSIEEAITAVGAAEGASPEDIAALNDAVTELQANPEILIAIGAAILGVVALIGAIAGLVRLLVINPLEVGCQNYFICNAEAPAELNALGRGFNPYGRNVGAMFLRGLFLFLWSLLFIIPGIIKAYSYRMVPYILADNPDMKGMEAITLSRRMMDGQKWNAFVLDLSFIGWALLSALTLGLLGIFYVHPYRFCTNAELYHTLKEQY